MISFHLILGTSNYLREIGTNLVGWTHFLRMSRMNSCCCPLSFSWIGVAFSRVLRFSFRATEDSSVLRPGVPYRVYPTPNSLTHASFLEELALAPHLHSSRFAHRLEQMNLFICLLHSNVRITSYTSSWRPKDWKKQRETIQKLNNLFKKTYMMKKQTMKDEKNSQLI